MRVICARKDLYEGVQTAARAVSTRTSLPILHHMLIKTEEDALRISATDLEIGLECLVEAKIVEAGSLTAPAKMLTEVLASLPEADVELSVDEETQIVSIKCGTSDFTIMGLPPDEYPQLAQVVPDVSFTVEREALRDAIKRTAFAISQDETRPSLTGLLVQVMEESVNLVATDTHRLTLAECAILSTKGTVNALVPGRAMNELSKIIPEIGDPIETTISQRHIMFKIGNTMLISRLIEEMFPNYQKVIPSSHDKTLIIPTNLLTQSVKRAEIVARENSHRTIFVTMDGKLTLSAESGGVGKVQEEVEVVKEGEDIKMAFNAKYFLDFLSIVDAESIVMELSGPVSPVLIRPNGQDDYTYVLMPMQLE